MRPSRLTAVAVLAGAGLVLAACGSDAPLAPGSTAPKSSSSAPASSSSAPASSSSAPTTTAASPTSSGSGRTGSCTDSQAKYCDDFSDPSSGWPTQNTATGYTQYDEFLGGTYRLGLRGQGIVGQRIPVQLSDVSPTYSVQIDTDVTVGTSSSNGTDVGYRCWTGTTSVGSGSGFQLLVNGSRIQIGVFSSLSGRFTVLKTQPFVGLRPGRTNHVAVQCLQRTGSSGVEAVMAMRINNAPAAQVTYPKGTQSVSWDATNGVSLLAQGTEADVFFDNVSIAPVRVS